MGSPEVVSVSGFAKPPFEAIEDVFGRMVSQQGRGGAALSIYHDGAAAVDLVAGDYRPDSLQLLFSATKVATAIASAMAHRDGALDLDAPLGDYWPEFAKSTTAMITLRSVLSHRSGLASFDARLTLDQVLNGEDETAIEIQEPYWEPNTRHGYHAFTFGTLVTGAFSRVLGQRLGDFVRTQIAEPLDLDMWIGAPDEAISRLMPVRYDPPRLTPNRAEHLSRSRIPSITAQLNATMDLYNDVRVARASWAGTSGIAGARDLARLMYATLDDVDGVRLLDDASRQAMTASRSSGFDEVLGIQTQFGSGVQLPFPQLPFLGPRSYGHEGAAGSAVAADPDLGVAVGYTSDVYPSMMGASVGFLALMPTIAHCIRTNGDTN